MGLLDFLQSASNSAASNVTAPVDGIAWLLRKAGIDVGEPMGGSDWAKRQGLMRDVPQSAASLGGELVGLLSPMVAAAKAPQIARGLLQGAENLAAPASIVGPSAMERGMLKIDGRGKAPETRADVNRLSDRLGRLLDDAGVQYSHDKSALSPARYFEFPNPSSADDALKVRISDHMDIHGGNTFSVDPTAATTWEEMLSGLRNAGVQIADRAKPASKAVMDDETLQKVWGISVDAMKARGMDIDAMKARYKMSAKGHWVEK